MRMTLSLFLLCLVSAAQASVSTAVGQVGSHILTSREVQISYVIEQILLNKGALKGAVAKNALLTTDDERFKGHVQELMIEQLVRLEAETFSVAQVSPEELQKDFQLVKESASQLAVWKKLEVKDEEIQNILSRKKSAKQFLKFKTESAGVSVSEEEAKAYFEKNRMRFGNAPYSQFRAGILEMLAQKQLEEKLKDWFEALKRKYKVRLLQRPT